MAERPVTLCLTGDVMTGRGVDQILRRPSDPALREAYVSDARTYVQLAEDVNGPVPRPVDAGYLWGDALGLLDDIAPDVRLVNLETSVTTAGDFAPGKAVHYRMHPANVDCLVRFRPVCALGNNHVLDFGPSGLVETCDTLDAAGIRYVGAGRGADQAARPLVVDLADRGRLLVAGYGTESAGVPPYWAAGPETPGVNHLPDLSERTAVVVAEQLRQWRRPDDVLVVSVHWGSNWGYDVPRAQRRFAHRLIDAGVDLVHGHSSHHPRPVEVYRGRLVLYGCGDLIDDYEGITGYEAFRPEVRLLYVAELRPGDGTLVRLGLWPMRIRRLRLERAGPEDTRWLLRNLNRTYDRFQLTAEPASGGCFKLVLPD